LTGLTKSLKGWTMFQKVKELVDRGERFLIATHTDPDGDALGSAFSLCFALQELRKEAWVYLRDSVPYQYEFLPRPRTLLLGPADIETRAFDALFVLDCGDFHRVGDELLRFRNNGFIINIDHHDANEAFGQLNILDERASSTAEILYRVLKALDVPITTEMAVNLYTAVFTDTGSLRYPNTNALAFTICQEMVNHGVVPSSVASAIYENHPKARFDLLYLALATLRTYRDGRIATMYVTREMFDQSRAAKEHTEGFVEELKQMRGVEVSLFVRETGPTRFKASMRAKGTVDLAAVARSFGGGGHKNAAGCIIEGPLEQSIQTLIEAIPL
jgi:bifunctional oligoribonuclease and PAP phosphatase NrnA